MAVFGCQPLGQLQLHPQQGTTVQSFCEVQARLSTSGTCKWKVPHLTVRSARLEIRAPRVTGRLVAQTRRDSAGHVTRIRAKEQEVVNRVEMDTHGRQERLMLEDNVPGVVGKYAVLATLLLGVGVGCLTSIGDAEAATAHIKTGALDLDMRAVALGPEGPLLEEFWDNMRRYGLYFLTVVSGGLYTLAKPVIDALRNPVTAVLVVIVVTGTIFLISLTVGAMLGLSDFKYDYAV